MRKPKQATKLILASFSIILSTLSLSYGQILINNFDNWLSANPNGGFASNSWDFNNNFQVFQGSGFVSVQSISGGSPTGEGNLYVDVVGVPPLDLSAFNYLALTAQLQNTNTNTSFTVGVTDSNGDEIGNAFFAAALFNTSSFFQAVELISWSVPARRNDVGGVFIYGDGSNASVANVSLSDVSAAAVPEPSTWALIIVGLTLIIAFRRRIKA